MAPKQKPGRSKQDYRTPPEFLAAVKRRLGIEEFDCDLAASPENAIAPYFYTEADDSLRQSWACGDGWNWLNPPYANIRPWVERASDGSYFSNIRTAVLVPAGVGANWWRDCVHAEARVLLLNGRLTFVGCTTPYPKDCALLLFGDEPGYEVWNWREQ